MALNLTEFLASLAGLSADDRAAKITETLGGEGLNLADLRADLVNKANELVGIENLTDEQITDSESVAALITGVNTKINEIAARTAAAEATREALKNAVEQQPATPEAASTPEAPAADQGSPASEAPPAEPAAAPEAAGATEGRELAGVTAAGPLTSVAAPRIPLGAIPDMSAPATPDSARLTQTLVASGDVPGFSAGTPLDTMEKLVAAVQSGIGAIGRAGGGRTGLAVINREGPEELIYNHDSDWTKLEAICQPGAVTDEALTAAAGWCAPSEILYDPCPVVSTREGLLALPTMLSRRGGVRYAARPDFSAIYSTAGWFATEAQIIAGFTKPCVEIPCPADLSECRMDVTGICLTANILMEKGWPERINEYIQYALIAHAHRVNAEVIERVVALATNTVTIATPPAATPSAAVVDPMGPGMTETILGAIELQVQYLRYKWRLSQNATLDGMAPYWFPMVVRSDLSKKTGVDLDRLGVTDAQIMAWFASRGVRLQLVYDWQDALATGNAADFGGTPPTRFPATVQIMLWEPGTFFRLTSPVINLDAIYDKAGLQANQYTRLFTEEGFQVCARCGNSILLNLPLCPNGLSGAEQTTNCAA